jgi:nucleoside-diphosphate-sugar epimerase
MIAAGETILITGASGRIGSYLARHFSGRYTLSLTDARPPVEDVGHPFAQADITNLEAMHRLCQGAAAVVHLAADPSTKAAWESLLPNNIVGAYNLFEAARASGCRRVVFASTINTVGSYPRDMQVHTGLPPRPGNLYGASKVWGETLARLYADQHGLSAICLRFGAVVEPGSSEWLRPDSPLLDSILTMADLARLVEAALAAPETLRFGVFHGVSNNRHKRLDISDARDVLGYAPQDDSYALVEGL